MFRKSLCAIALSGALIAVPMAAAFAADLPLKAPPPAPLPMINWTGWYVGANVGYAWSDDPFSMSTVSGAGFPLIGAGTSLYTTYGNPFTTTLHPNGGIGGVQVGYNYQFDPKWVAGIEADIQGSGISGSDSCLLPCGTPLVVVTPGPGIPGVVSSSRVTFSNISAKDKLNWFDTVRGRFGYTPWGSVLFYVTGGLAYGQVERSGSVSGKSTNGSGSVTYNTFAGSYDNSSTQVGWTIGGGIEDKLTANWSVKAEYLYVDLGSFTDVFNTLYQPGSAIGTPGTVAGVRTDSSSFRENIFRVGVNYEFH